MSVPAFRALRRVSLLSEICEAGPSRPRTLRTTAPLAARPVPFPPGVRAREAGERPLGVEAPDTGRRPRYKNRSQALSSRFKVRERGDRAPVLLNQLLDPGTLPWDVPATDLYAVSGAVNWCLTDPSGNRERLALRLVHTHLSLTLEPAPHTRRYQAQRSHQYAWFMAQLLTALGERPSVALHANAQSLLQRQLAERVPLQPWVVGRVLAGLRPALSDVLPLLPELDSRNYASMLRVIVQDYAPPPADLRAYVAQTQGPEEGWSYDVLAALVYAHFPSLDFRGALVALGELRARVQRDKDAALAQGAPWPPPGDASAVAVLESAYTDVMSLWARSRFHRSKRNPRLNSTVPAKLAADLVQVLRTDGADVQLPPAFLNTWFNAERIAQNHANVNRVWQFMAGSSIDETLAGRIARPGGVGKDAVIALLKYLKVHRVEAARHDLRPLLALLPVRDGNVLNAFLAVLGVHPDLNLVIAILQSELPLDARGVDLCAAAVIYHLRGILGQPWTAQSVFVDGAKFPTDAGGKGNHISAREWDWIAQLLAARETPTQMPLSLPTATLEEQRSSDVAPQFAKWYGPMTRVISEKDEIDKKVAAVRPVLADAVRQVTRVLAKREDVAPEALEADREEAERLVHTR